MVIRMLLTAVLLVIIDVNEVSCQVTSGMLVYESDNKRVLESNRKNPSGNMADALIKRAAELIGEIRSELYFNEGQAVFKLQKSLTTFDDPAFDRTVKYSVSDGEYYTNIRDSVQIWITELAGRNFNVEKDFENRDWVLSKETKKIGDFLCYKATFQKERFRLYDKEPAETQEVIAWYTPEIPISLGPKDYIGGLPGLIMELDLPSMRYRCVLLELNTNPEIDWPKDLTTISQADYDQELEKLLQTIRDNDNN